MHLYRVVRDPGRANLWPWIGLLPAEQLLPGGLRLCKRFERWTLRRTETCLQSSRWFHLLSVSGASPVNNESHNRLWWGNNDIGDDARADDIYLYSYYSINRNACWGLTDTDENSFVVLFIIIINRICCRVPYCRKTRTWLRRARRLRRNFHYQLRPGNRQCPLLISLLIPTRSYSLFNICYREEEWDRL